ncbi:hypothetical protein LXT21_15030 [Myxococcus sp. K38C18041901]|nr:hypothetical protein [Myxococcus guangdongensis]MCP3060096.1 hypothetical protein [Myxococcus guangdongensis]
MSGRYGGRVDASHRWRLPGLLRRPSCGVNWLHFRILS